MKAFYDNIIPSSVNKLVKPFGIKSEVITLPEGTEQLSIPYQPEDAGNNF